MRGASGIRWQLPSLASNVAANDGKISISEFKNVGATTGCIAGTRTWGRPDSAAKFNCCAHTLLHSDKHRKNARIKYSVYAVVRICGFEFPCVVAKIPKYRKVLGENIRIHRRNLKWSQEKLAEKSDLHHNYIGDIERGEENVSVDALMRIAVALKISIPDLVQGM